MRFSFRQEPEIFSELQDLIHGDEETETEILVKSASAENTKQIWNDSLSKLEIQLGRLRSLIDRTVQVNEQLQEQNMQLREERDELQILNQKLQSEKANAELKKSLGNMMGHGLRVNTKIANGPTGARSPQGHSRKISTQFTLMQTEIDDFSDTLKKQRQEAKRMSMLSPRSAKIMDKIDEAPEKPVCLN